MNILLARALAYHLMYSTWRTPTAYRSTRNVKRKAAWCGDAGGRPSCKEACFCHRIKISKLIKQLIVSLYHTSPSHPTMEEIIKIVFLIQIFFSWDCELISQNSDFLRIVFSEFQSCNSVFVVDVSATVFLSQFLLFSTKLRVSSNSVLSQNTIFFPHNCEFIPRNLVFSF